MDKKLRAFGNLIESFYFLINVKVITKYPFSQETTSLNVRIPDTLIFKGPQATFWYFTSENGRVLKKKTS